MRAITIESLESGVDVCVIGDEEIFSLKRAQEIVDGYVELVRDLPMMPENEMLCNEEGLLMGLPINHMASSIACCHLVGNCILLKKGELT